MRERRVLWLAVLRGERSFDALEATRELRVCVAQARLGVDAEMPRNVYHDEKEVPKLLGDTRRAISVRAVLTRRDRRSELGDLFFGLGEDWAKARPVEANFCRTFLQLYRAGESRERNRHFVEARDLTLYTASSSLFGLDALP